MLYPQLVPASNGVVFQSTHRAAATATQRRRALSWQSVRLSYSGSEALPKLPCFHLLTAKERKDPTRGTGGRYLFGHALSLAPEPPPARLLWHLFFDPRLNSGLKNETGF